MTYETSVAFSGDAGKAIEAGVGMLAGSGFRIERRTEGGIEATGPGMMNTKQPPIMGVTRAEVRVGAGNVTVRAELGGVVWMGRFLLLFIGGLAVAMAGLFTAASLLGLWGEGEGGRTWKWGWGMLAFAPWVVIGPVMVRWMRVRTERAVDTLAHNMTVMGR